MEETSQQQSISVKDQLRKLVELQKVDSEVYEYQVQLDAQPEILKELAASFHAKKAHLHELEEDVKAVVLERKNLEGELQQKEEAIQKADGQLSQLKTNKEYQAKLFEIDTLKADKSVIEDKILNSFDNLDEEQAKIDEEKKVVEEHEAKYNEEKARIEALIEELQGKIDQLKSTNRALEKEVDAEILARYQKILPSREGIAVVSVQSDSCGGCHMNVPPQQINQIKKYEEVVGCEFCQRILYLEDEI